MVEFEALEFKEREDTMPGTRAEIHFDNGYGASVITGAQFYTDPEHPYELAVLHGDVITYDTHITDDVLGHLTKADVTRILIEIQELEKREESVVW